MYAYSNTDCNSIGIGYSAGWYKGGGSNNVAIGFCAGYNACSPCGMSVAIGGYALGNSGYRSVAMGYYALGNSAQQESAVAVGAYALAAMGKGAAASHNIALGYSAGRCYNGGCNCYGGNYNIYIGIFSKPSSYNHNCQVVIGAYAIGNGSGTFTAGASTNNYSYFCGAFVKSSGYFRITHPNPKKKDKFLYHSFVESPTAGDNIYRWSFNVCGCEHRFKLPNYYKYLNECNMAWVYPADHFGEGHAKLDEEKENLIIKTNKDGCYNVLVIGTRCDTAAVKAWTGIEVDMDKSEIEGNYDKNRQICSLTTA
jgi:hypothetical protein